MNRNNATQVEHAQQSNTRKAGVVQELLSPNFK
uniref:Uncharacterized protein n=1 Tax=Arundo donax TaxID=35708 RepID=A0A0A9GW91_ARUDO